jgi:hypothetical protein
LDPWITIANATVRGSDTELTLSQRNDDFAVRVAGVPGDLMNGRMHHSEDALTELACARSKIPGFLSVVSAWASRWRRHCESFRCQPK